MRRDEEVGGGAMGGRGVALRFVEGGCYFLSLYLPLPS